MNLFFSSKHNFVYCMLTSVLCPPFPPPPPPPPNMLTSSQMYQQLICYKTSQRPTLSFGHVIWTSFFLLHLRPNHWWNMALEPVDCNQKCPICDWNSESGVYRNIFNQPALVCLAWRSIGRGGCELHKGQDITINKMCWIIILKILLFIFKIWGY